LLESISKAISVGGWSSSTQAEIHPLAKTDWRLIQHNSNRSQRVFHFGIEINPMAVRYKSYNDHAFKKQVLN
jgi:hypothetical protein